MYRERYVKCADCGDKFKIIYDSMAERQIEFKCKCGKFKGTADSFGGFSYNSSGHSEKLSYEESESKSSRYEDDYIKLTDEELKLITEIDEVGILMGYSYSNKTNKDRIQIGLSGCSTSNEGLFISSEIRLESNDGWRDYALIERHERIIESLTRFKNIITKVKEGEIDLDKPKVIWSDNLLEWNNGTKEQQKIYDYELYC